MFINAWHCQRAVPARCLRVCILIIINRLVIVIFLSVCLQQQPATISFAARAFCAAAPTVWNSLGVHTNKIQQYAIDKSRLVVMASYQKKAQFIKLV